LHATADCAVELSGPPVVEFQTKDTLLEIHTKTKHTSCKSQYMLPISQFTVICHPGDFVVVVLSTSENGPIHPSTDNFPSV
jgi:hypothetical protein